MTELQTAAVAAMTGGLATPLMLYAAHRASHRPVPVTATTAAVAAFAVGAAIAARTPSLALAVVVFGMPAAIVDVLERRLPDVLTAGLAIAAATAVSLARPHHILSAAAAALLAAAAVATIKMITPQALGWGDVKMVPSLVAIMAAAGPVAVYRGVVLWAVLLIVTVVMWLPGRLGDAETIPYGPALIVGAVGSLLAA